MFFRLGVIGLLLVLGDCLVSGDEYFRIVPPALNSVRFVDDRHGWLAGNKGLFYTDDGGETWQRQPIKLGAALHSSVRLAIEEEGRIVFADQNSAIVRTATGLATGDAISQVWNHIPIARRILQGQRSMAFADRLHGWSVGPFGAAYRTSDSGKTWTRIATRTVKHLHSVFVVAYKDVWVSGGEGILMHTMDGGETWKWTQIDTSADLFFVKFFGAQEGWVCGTAGLVLHTSDGGEHWDRMRLPFSSGTGLNSASFLTKHEGWLAGVSWYDDNVSKKEKNIIAILYTKDEGLHWETQGSKFEDTLVDICALPSGKVWTIGINGTILRTLDYGKHWYPIMIE